MKEVKVTSVAKLIASLNKLSNNYIYRGQANASWTLASSLERLLDATYSGEKAQKHENYSLDKFRSKFHLYDHENAEPSSRLAWLSVMQHHGVPTRLLDFTESPYVALYFALEAYEPRSKQDFSIFAINYANIIDKSLKYISNRDNSFMETRLSMNGRQDEIFDKVIDIKHYEVAWITEPTQLNARLDRQAGTFLLSGNLNLQLDQVLQSELYQGVGMVKYTIPYILYEGVFSLLRKMNITSKSLYGDLDGLARSIRMEMQVYAS